MPVTPAKPADKEGRARAKINIVHRLSLYTDEGGELVTDFRPMTTEAKEMWEENYTKPSLTDALTNLLVASVDVLSNRMEKTLYLAENPGTDALAMPAKLILQGS